jgi:murein DD-endopeptidase MepM/ murein hydrolase activator NlpD
VRATSPPTALPVAAAALALVAAVLASLAVPSTALAERWLRPVPGEVARPFSYTRDAPFVRGAHRGADLTAAPGTMVRAACSGRVVHAGPVAGRDEVVSVRCRARRVSYLPLAAVAVRAGAKVRAGDPIGTLAPGHGGLHFGVRRERDAFGYVDPMALLPDPERPFTPTPHPPRSRPLTPRPAARPAVPRPAARPASWPATAPRPLAGRPPAQLAPWPVWAGLGALLAGAAGSGTVALRRRRTTAARAAVAAAAR